MSALAPAGHPLVGRERELGLLEGAWRRCLAEGPQLALVSGEAGLGKTSVVGAFVAALDDGATVLVGNCVGGFGDTLPYAPITQALKGLVAEAGADEVARWAGAGRDALGVVLPALRQPGAPDPDRMQVFEAVASVLEGAARRRPVVVVVEDLHWADQSSAALFRFLDAALAREPVLLVATYRSEEVVGRHPLRPLVAELLRRPSTTRVELGLLDPGEVAQLVRPFLGERATPAVIARIVERSEGVPFFAEELACSGVRGAPPSTLNEALLARVQMLPDPARRVVRLAAPAGERVTHALLAAVCGLDDDLLEEALREAVDAGVLVPTDDGYRFRHALLREAVQDDLLPGELARLHGRYADLLVAQPGLGVGPATVARHLLEANRPGAAFRACIAAATELRNAHLDCLELYEAALGLWDQVEHPELVVSGGRDVLLDLAAQAAYWNGDSARALALVEQSLAETTPDADPLLRSRRLLLKARADFDNPAMETAWAAYALTPDDEATVERADVLDLLASRAMLYDTPARTVELAEQGLVIAREVGRVPLVANLLITQGCALCNMGRDEEGLALIEEGGRLCAPRRRLRYFTNLSHHLNYLGEYGRAAALAGEGVVAARAFGLERYLGSMLAGNTAEALVALGSWAEAERIVRRALALNPPVGYRNQLRLLQGFFGWLRGDDGTLAEVVADMQPQIECPEAQPQYQTAYRFLAAESALRGGDPAAAWEVVAAEVRRGVRQAPYAAWQLACVGRRALRRLGGHEAEVAFLDEHTRAIPTGRVTPLFEAWYAAEASDDAASWRGVLTALPDVLPVWLGLEAYARAAEAGVRAGDGRAARADADAGLRLAAPLGDTAWSARLGELRGAAGVTGLDAAGSGLLTPRELEVLRLVAEGRSNGEIGRALHVTPKTASVHVSNILAKLGVSGRGEAAAWAHRTGLAQEPTT